MDALTNAAYYLLDARMYLLPYLPIKPICDIVDQYSRSALLFENILFSDTSITAADLVASEDPNVQNWCKEAIGYYGYDVSSHKHEEILRRVIKHWNCVCLRPQCYMEKRYGLYGQYGMSGTKCICGWPLPCFNVGL